MIVNYVSSYILSVPTGTCTKALKIICSCLFLCEYWYLLQCECMYLISVFSVYPCVEMFLSSVLFLLLKFKKRKEEMLSKWMGAVQMLIYSSKKFSLLVYHMSFFLLILNFLFNVILSHFKEKKKESINCLEFENW